MNYVYLVEWSYYSCLDGGSNIRAVCTDYESAKLIATTSSCRILEQETSKKTGDMLDCWTDGDYWVSINKVKTNTEDMYGD